MSFLKSFLAIVLHFMEKAGPGVDKNESKGCQISLLN